LARALAAFNSSWRTETFDLADGHAVLLGSGLYVNRALAAGLEEDVTDTQLDLLDSRSRAVGVESAFEVSEQTLPSVVARLTALGFQAGNETSLMVHDLDGRSPDEEPSIEVEVIGDSGLAAWQAATAEGWGHRDREARRGSDAFAAAAAGSQSPGLMLARSLHDGRVMGCAALSIRGGLAILGAMSTLPTERQRGVHGALIKERLRMASDQDCVVAIAQCAPGGGSERNLIRFGFMLVHRTTTWTKSSR